MKKYFKQFMRHNAAVMSIYLIFAVLTNISPLLTMTAFDKLLQNNMNGFLQLMGIKVGLAIILLLMNYSRNVEKAKVTSKMQTALRQDITKKLENCSYSVYNKENSGTYLSWLNNDVQTINTSGFSAVYDVLDLGAMALFAFIPLFFIHWSIAAASVILSFIVIFVPKLFQKKMTDAIVQFSIQKQIFVSKVKDALSGFDVLFSFNLRNRITNEVEKASNALADKNVYQTKKVITPAIMLAFFSMVAGLIILIYTGILAGYKLVNISAMIAINSLANTLFSSLTNIATRGMNIKTVFPILKKFENIEINSEAKNLLQPSFKNKIKITNLNFAYTPEKPILKNVNMEFEIGKKYGIIGESGSGKTTFFKLLNGMLEDYEGKIEYDGISLLNLDKEKIRENVAYIDQNVYIFNDTVKENICLGKNYPDEKIDNSIKESALLPMIQNLENGINTPASENGKNFSGGQRQRIAIARALIHGRKILLIDEGTSSLDKENALEIEKRLIENPDLTVIMISHNFDPQIKEKLDGVYKL